MSLKNIFKVRRGSSKPTIDKLKEFELGWDKKDKQLYINSDNEIVPISDKRLDTLPIGAVVEWDSDTIPENWLLLNGQEVDRTEYFELFELYGTRYGEGNGSTTFNLPNRQGKVPVGKSQDSEFNTIGKTGGEKTHFLSQNEIPAHTHTRGNMNITGAFGIAYMTGNWAKTKGAFYTGLTDTPSAIDDPTATSYHDYSYGFDASRNWTGETSSVGGNDSHNNLQPYITINFIVKAKMYTSGFVNGMIIDNLDSTSTTNALSANMGRELKLQIPHFIPCTQEYYDSLTLEQKKGNYYFILD